MTTIKTAISLPEPLFTRIETVAHELKLSRSHFFALAAEAYIHKYENQKLLEIINEAYQDSQEEELMVSHQMSKHQLDLLVGETW